MINLVLYFMSNSYPRPKPQLLLFYNPISLQSYSINLYINLAWVSGCLSVCLYPIKVKTAEPIGPKFVWDLMWPQGRFYDWSKLKKFEFKNFLFCKILKIREKIRKLFLFCFLLYKEKMLTDKATVKSWNRRCSVIRTLLYSLECSAL